MLRPENLFEIGRGFAGLRAVGLVDDHRAFARGEVAAFLAPLLRHLEELLANEGKLLERGDDDRHPVLKRLG